MFDSLELEKKRADRKMAELSKKSHIPAQLLDLVAVVMDLQREARAEAPAVEAPRELLATVGQVIAGAPLLAREAFHCDQDRAAKIFERLLETLSGMGGPMAQAAGMVREKGEPLMKKAFEAFIANDEAFFADFAQRAPQAPRTLSFLAQSSLTPGIMGLAEAISRLLPENRTWEQGTCPLCGSLPFHSSLVTKEGVRVNSCSFCRADYRSLRLQCAYCQERDTNNLPFFTADEEPGYRVDACQTCKGYIKTTDFREFDRASHPALDDLESLALDILATRKGFIRPTASAWGF